MNLKQLIVHIDWPTTWLAVLNQRRYGIVALLLAGAALLLSFGYTALFFVQHQPLLTEPLAQPASTDVAKPDHQSLIADLADFALFGEPLVVVTKPSGVVKPRLSLRLIGTNKAITDSQSGSAIIAATGEKPTVFVVGDQIFAQAKLLEIHADYVLIATDQGEQRLSLPLAEP